MTNRQRRQFLRFSAAGAAAIGLPVWAQAERRFEPQPGAWRHFEVSTRVEIADLQGATRVWLPLPSVDTDYQHSLSAAWSGNATQTQVVSDRRYGARMLQADFEGAAGPGVIELTTAIATRSRAENWAAGSPQPEDTGTLKACLAATDLMPTDGIVKDTALKVTKGAKTDVDKVRALYDWVVNTTYREPKVRGCGVGDIKSMLETGNFGGKCADINALFVGMARSVGVPARDVYGIRVAPSAFGYKELGGNPASLKGAQHCRAEVYLKAHGWVAMDPADVAKVMRQETTEWIKDTCHAVVAPVYKGLFGGWEGNWMAFNSAHDVALPGSTGPKLGFLMYPQAENKQGRFDPLDPDRFKYTISAREIAA
jgi:transglutaminase-like putative cysteine protease